MNKLNNMENGGGVFNVFDFETTTNIEAPEVWLWGCSINGVYNTGTEIASFMSFVESFKGGILYAYNTKFDFSFILEYVRKNARFSVGDQLHTGIFKTFRQAEICFPSGRKFELRDASPLFSPAPLPLSKILKSWAPDFVKGETPLLAEKPSHIKPKWLAYLRTDVLGLQAALEKRFKIAPFERGKPPLTASSQVKTICKKMYGKEFCGLFKSLKLEEDDALRPFYRGGFVYLNSNYQSKELKNVKVFDVNSYYPWIMSAARLPIGYPQPREGKLNGYLFSQKIELSYANLKEGRIPFLTHDRKFTKGKSEYLKRVEKNWSVKERTFFLTNLELELLELCYDYEIKCYLGGFLFKSRVGIFKEFVETYRERKENSTGALREFAKLCLNSPSGKWGQNPRGSSFEAYSDEGFLKYREKEQDPLRPFYLPVSIFITATARVLLIKEILRIGVENFVYCDTDSVHVLKGQPADIHPSRFGSWKEECVYESAKYLKTKCYSGLSDGKIKNVIAGIPSRFSNKVITHPYLLRAGLQIPVKRMGVVKGGMAMIDRIIEI